METDNNLVAEAGEFLDMMRRAYHGVWRQRSSGDHDGDFAISVIEVILMFEECENHRSELARISCRIYDEGNTPDDNMTQIKVELDATWRSLFWSVVSKKKPRFVPKMA